MTTTYNFGQLEAIWLSAGGSALWAPVMAGVALAESGGDPTVVAGGGSSIKNSTDGFGGSVGLWQINGSSFGVTDSTPPSQGGTAMPAADVTAMQDPLQNAKQAVSMFNSRGLNPWANDSVAQPLIDAGFTGKGSAPSFALVESLIQRDGHAVTNGYDLTGQSQAQIVAWMQSVIQSLPGFVNTTPDQNIPVVKQITQGITTVSGLIGDVTNPSYWKTAGEYVLAGLLVIFGSILFFRSTATGQKVEGAATSAATAAAV